MANLSHPKHLSICVSLSTLSILFKRTICLHMLKTILTLRDVWVLGQISPLLIGLSHALNPCPSKRSSAYCAFSCPDEFWDQLVKFHSKEIWFGLRFHWIYRRLKRKKTLLYKHSFPILVHLSFHILLLLLPFWCYALYLSW